jgi:hypothetical protein
VRAWPVATAAALALVLLCAGCSNAAPITETRDVRHVERLVAAYAETHRAEVAPPAACAARIIGETAHENGSREVYFELMCARLMGRPPCPDRDSSAGITLAAATVSAAGAVSALAVDYYNDEAYHRWADHHFPSRWRHVEEKGPKYGSLLRARLLKRHPCPPGVQPMP